jgi:hypothetical protein
VTRPLYSGVLFQGLDLPAGFTDSGGPDDGNIWIIRDATSVAPSPFGQASYGWIVQNGALVTLLGIAPPNAWWGGIFSWTGRQVVEEGDTTSFFAIEEGWTIALSGYVLTAP